MTAAIGTLFLDSSGRKMDEMMKTIEACLEKLDEEQVWRRSGPHENSVGNLVLHLCGNIRQRIMSGLGGAADVRMRDAEFSTSGGIGRGELTASLQRTVAEAKEILAALPHARLTQRIQTMTGEMSVLEAIYQVIGHLQQHTGQIIVLTKQMLGKDLDLTIPRPR
ncbi:MAG TPA: DUF1572 family protein [Acidobacteriaceae bacterium]|nr:DUF1572 family protein [Acidobacteriaceae bacterium]